MAIMIHPPSTFRHIRAVLFDLYGTLVDIQGDETSTAFWNNLQEALRSRGISANSEMLHTRYLQLCNEEAAKKTYAGILNQVFARWTAELNPAQDDRLDPLGFARIFRELSSTTERRDYAIPLLTTLRDSGVKLAILSNTEALFTRVDLGDVKLRPYVDKIVLSSELGVEKPNPQAFELTEKRLGIRADASVYVGDSWATDVNGALAAGMPVVYLTNDVVPGDPSRRRIVRAQPNLASILAALHTADDMLGNDH